MESTKKIRALKRKHEDVANQGISAEIQDNRAKILHDYPEDEFTTEVREIAGDFQVAPTSTETLIKKYGNPRSSNDEYKILKFVGEGSFGKVAECLKKGSKETVAVKICKIRRMSAFRNECSILRKLNVEDPDKFNFVRNAENFIFKGQFFMVFEMLQQSLRGYLKESGYRPVPMEGIRHITQQLLVAQDKLRQLQIIHGDLKPGNIMLVNHEREPFKIKIVDFGLSIQRPNRCYSTTLGTLTYRAPEIMLGLPYDEAVDMWSTGCIVAEMLVGAKLYPGCSCYDQIRFMDETQGPFPDFMLRCNKFSAKYFCRQDRRNVSKSRWRLKSPEEYLNETGVKSHDARIYPLKDLDGLFLLSSRVRNEYDEINLCRRHCVDMIRDMLILNHKRRIFPSEALTCDFLRV